MRILHLSTYDSGGAANAAIRLHNGLLEIGIDSHILFGSGSNKDIPNSCVSEHRKKGFLLQSPWSKHARIKKLLKKRDKQFEGFSLPWGDPKLLDHPEVEKCDIINLHWVGNNFWNYANFGKLKKPIIWTLHDMNPFTGGCHYSWHCRKFETTCTNCFQLEGTKNPNITATLLSLKERMVNESRLNLTIVSPSQWLLEESKKSRLFNNFKHLRIPYGLDSDVFRPTKKEDAREHLGLSHEKELILFVAQSTKNPRKGIENIKDALDLINRPNLEAIAVGEKPSAEAKFPSMIKFVGSVNEPENLALYYSASDFFVIPSLHDNLPNTVIESIMCGTPVIGFSVGGIPDMIKSGINGYLAPATDSDSLAKTINRALDHKNNFSRDKIRSDALIRFSQKIQAYRYKKLYENSTLFHSQARKDET